MKLKSNKTKKVLTIIGIALLAVLLMVGAILVVSSIVEENKGKQIKDIVISSMPTEYEYYIGDEFDPVGTYVQVKTVDMNNTYFVDHTKLTFSGFDSSVANEALTITVSYKGFTTTFTVKVKEHEAQPPHLVSIEAKDLKTTYSLERWNKNGPDYNNSYLLCTYSDGTTENVWIQNTWATQREIMDAPGTTFVTIEYMGKSIQVEFTITN